MSRPAETIHPLLARIGHALSSPPRLAIVNRLFQREHGVDELAEALGRSPAAISAHLKVLREVNLVEVRKEGRRVLCRIAGDDVARLWLALHDVGEARLPAVRETLRSAEADEPPLTPVDAPELLERCRKGEVLVLDLRPSAEFAAGHLPCARSIPFEELEDRLSEVPADLPVVAYCRGPYCAMAIAGTRRLHEAGRAVSRLRGGVAEWRALGRPLERA